jgi:hypothetical protein
VRFEVLSVVTVKHPVFCVVMPCGLVEIYRSFGVTASWPRGKCFSLAIRMKHFMPLLSVGLCTAVVFTISFRLSCWSLVIELLETFRQTFELPFLGWVSWIKERIHIFMCLTSCIIRQLTGEKVTNKCTVIVYLFLKFIYIFESSTRHAIHTHHYTEQCYTIKNC